MDIRPAARDTRGMPSSGRSRQRLAGVLNAAFAEGLLSEQTHSYRLGLLFGSHLVDEQGLIGDLALRDQGSSTVRLAREAWSALLERLRTSSGRLASSPATVLLVLDSAERDELVLGRGSRCDVVINEPSVSRRHARLSHRDGVWVIRDLASTNGTAVNGVRVGRSALRPGDVLTLGGQSVRID